MCVWAESRLSRVSDRESLADFGAKSASRFVPFYRDPVGPCMCPIITAGREPDLQLALRSPMSIPGYIALLLLKLCSSWLVVSFCLVLLLNWLLLTIHNPLADQCT